MKEFVHLHLHTDYSLLKSTVRLKPLAEKLLELQMKACAVTDYANMYGAISFYNQLKNKGIKPIIGYDANLTFGSRHQREMSVRSGELPFYQIVLLAINFEGYKNLIYLASKAFIEGMHHQPRIDMEILEEKSGGLIALTGGARGAVGHFLQRGETEKAVEAIRNLREIFGRRRLFLEIQDHDLPEDKILNKSLPELAKKTEIELVAANDVHYLTADDARAHEVLMCLGDGKTINDASRQQFGSVKYHLRSAEEMWDVFGTELPGALHKTVEIAEMCELEMPSEAELALPKYPIPPESGLSDPAEYLEKVVRDGFEMRKKTVLERQQAAGQLKYSLEEYQKRIETELKIINQMGFPGYFLIVWDFIRHAKAQDIPVGPGRGSAAGSLAAFCLEITDIDPIQYDLLFERFLNPERISMPDIDIDFCVHGRSAVIDHVTEFYGRESVCQIITFGTMASKAAIKDVGRVLNRPLGEVEKIAKLIPPPVRGRNISISAAIKQVADLGKIYDTDPAVRELVDLALRLEGCARHTSVHAAGVVIAPQPLHELVPVTVSGKNELTSQYPMGDLEKVGMLKMDFLALTTLTIINECLKMLKKELNVEIDWTVVSLEDEATMKLFGEGRTEGVFQFESGGMQEICRRLKPKNLEDLAALNALYRPGPLDGGMVDDFIARHRGEKKVRYIVPPMKEILENTLGILVYQEQIMQLAQKLAGYTLGDADLMRRAMGKKKRDEMAIHQEKFVSGAVERGIKQEKAEEIFNLMEQFADYGFNRSHSVAYAYVAFQTAYLKAHYPTYYFSALLSNETQDSAKIYKYRNELRSGGLQLLPPDINESGTGFTPLPDAVRFGLSAIKGLGANSVRAIIEARAKAAFTSIYDFTERVEAGAVNRRGLESLIAAGAFDSLRRADLTINLWRAGLSAALDQALARGQRVWNDREKGQTGLFGAAEAKTAEIDDSLIEVAEWSQSELCRQEKNAVGFYLSNHPLEEFQQAAEKMNLRNIADCEKMFPADKVLLAGVVSDLQIKYSKKGNRFCIFKLEDSSKSAKCLVWSEALGKYGDCLKEDEVLLVAGRVESNEGQEITIIVEETGRMADKICEKASGIEISLTDEFSTDENLYRIIDLLGAARGKCQVYINFQVAPGIFVRTQNPSLRIRGSKNLENRLNDCGARVEWRS